MSAAGRAMLLASAMILAVPACGGDDDADVTTTGAPVTTTQPSTTAAPTTAAPPTVATTAAPTTDPAPPTTTEEDLKAVIAADVVEATEVNYAALVEPSMEALPSHLAAVVVPGSPAEQSLSAYVAELVRVGDGIIPGDPDILKVTVENVELVGPTPVTMALVTLCEVENRPQATLAKNSPSGTPIEVLGTDELHALRQVYDVRLAPAGWRLYDTQDGSGFEYPGVDACPSA
jgi:hypothetical protein